MERGRSEIVAVTVEDLTLAVRTCRLQPIWYG